MNLAPRPRGSIVPPHLPSTENAERHDESPLRKPASVFTLGSAGKSDRRDGPGAARFSAAVQLATVRRAGAGLLQGMEARYIGIASVLLSLGIGFVLLLRHETLSGPGDQLRFYSQAAHLFPYEDRYYGPSYYVRYAWRMGLAPIGSRAVS
jgi:hypothetical protein